MKTYLKTLVTAALALSAFGAVRAADVTGKWKAEFDTQIGFSKYVYDLKAEGEKVTGKALRDIDGQKTETELKEGKVSGDEISFVEIVDAQGQEIRIEYKGKVAGDEIKFTRRVGDFSTIEMTAKREKATPALAGQWKSEFESPVGQLKYTYEFKVDGEKVSGKAIRDRDGEKTEVEIKEGKLNGSDVSFVEPLAFQDQELRIEYKGKLAEDEIKFTRQVGDFGTMDIVAKRVK